MVVRSNQTGLEHTITEEAWQKMKANGSSRRYIVVSNEAPPEVAAMKAVKADKSTNYDVQQAVKEIEKLSIDDANSFASGDKRKAVKEALKAKEEAENNESENED